MSCTPTPEAAGEYITPRREDLPEHLPSPLVRWQGAEAMVEGKVDGSYLAILSPDHMLFETVKASSQAPCWFVRSSKGDDPDIPWVTVINAMTGEVLGCYCPC